MIIETSIADQCARAAGDDVRILIVGAGIAGVTLAQLLRAQGRHPVLVERSPTSERMTGHDAAGYMLALMPLVDPVIADLDVTAAYRRRSILIDDYTLHSHRGRVLASGDIGSMLSDHGEYRGISRGDLISVLTSADCPLTLGTTPTTIAADQEVRVELATGAGEPIAVTVDLVVVADGLRSRTRDLVGAGDAEWFDTGWSAWVRWTDADDSPGAGTELWGDGFFIGAYPVKDRLGVVLAGPDSARASGAAPFSRRVRTRLTVIDARLDAALRAFETTEEPYCWPLRDVRSRRWSTGSSVLLGDAAAGFLPTAGVGAGMAMESAWALSEILRASTRSGLAGDLRRFEDVVRPRVETAQDNSRTLARLMFRSSTLFAAVRSASVRFLSLRTALSPIIGLLEHPIATALAEADPNRR